MQQIYSQKARDEFKDAVKWYEEREAGLGIDLEKEIITKVKMITNIRYDIV
ncbi:MAG: hypothetical protein ACR2KX_03485 [Chitinophagaceae bacterium]